jgi:hypothetical protein
MGISTFSKQTLNAGVSDPVGSGNAIINGAFDSWSRGTSFTNTSVQEYTADRWREYTAAVTVERSTDVPNNNFTYSLQTTIATTGFNIIGQRIESQNAKILSDTVTLSFWGKSISGTSVIRYNARRATAKDDFTTTTSIIQEDLELEPSSSWKKYSATFTIPSEAKQNGFEIRIIRDGAAVYRITGVQLESGPVATPFKPVSASTSLDTVASGSTGYDGVLVSTNSNNSISGSGTPAWAGYDVAGKNKIINGGMDIWQRGTSVTHSASTDSGGVAYTLDRFRAANVRDAVAWRNITVSRSTNVPLGFKYSAKVTTGSNDVNRLQFEQIGEDWSSLNGKPATFSFYIRRIGTAHASTNLKTIIGGGAGESVWGSFNSLSTSQFTRITRTVPAGSTITSIGIQIITDSISTPILTTAGDLFEITGVQLEAGTIATSFSLSAGTLQGELAACQRYYFRLNSVGGFTSLGFGQCTSTTQAVIGITFPVEMRTNPQGLEQSGTPAHYGVSGANGNGHGLSLVPAFAGATRNNATVSCTTGANLLAGNSTRMFDGNTTAAFLAWSAEV